MIDIPKWLSVTIDRYRCPHCNLIMKIEGIEGVGIKNGEKEKDKTFFYFSYFCEQCNKRSSAQLNPMTVEEFVNSMVEEYMQEGNSQEEKNKLQKDKKIQSKISEEEYQSMIKSINDCEYWDDFLLALNFSSQEIDNYKNEGQQEFNKRKSEI